MTRREFLKQLKKFLIGAIVLYLGRFFSFFHAGQPFSSKTAHPAKYYRQADDLAG
jgi:hypothetical protein